MGESAELPPGHAVTMEEGAAKRTDLAALRAVKKKLDGDELGIDAIVAGGALSCLAVAIARPFTPDASLLGSLLFSFVALFCTLFSAMLMGLLAAFFLGERRGQLLGAILALLGLALWELNERPVWYSGLIATVGLAGLYVGYKHALTEARRVWRALPERAFLALTALPEPLEPTLRRWTDEAITQSIQLYEISGVLQPVERDEARRALEQALVAGCHQVDVCHKLSQVQIESETLREARDRADQALADLSAGLQSVLEAAILGAAQPQSDALADLRERAASLRASAEAWQELEDL